MVTVNTHSPTEVAELTGLPVAAAGAHPLSRSGDPKRGSVESATLPSLRVHRACEEPSRGHTSLVDLPGQGQIRGRQPRSIQCRMHHHRGQKAAT